MRRSGIVLATAHPPTSAVDSEAGWLQRFRSGGACWERLAFCTGCGVEQINFIWYFKYISDLALPGYFGGGHHPPTLHALT